MDTDVENILLNEDENARDEFSAQQFFNEKRSTMAGFRNKQLSHARICKTLNATEILSVKCEIKKCILDDITNENDDKGIISLKRKNTDVGIFLESNGLKNKINRIEGRSELPSYFVSCGIELSTETGPDSLCGLNGVYPASEFIISLSRPANGYSVYYKNQVAVPEPWRCERLLKIDHKSAVGSTMLERAKVETRTLCAPCRMTCSPREQYSLTPRLQYRSDCLIRKFYMSTTVDGDAFTRAIVIDAVNKTSRRYPNNSHCYMPESVNTCHFHELYLEKLTCNHLCDFMPHQKQLTGGILGGFINDLFDLSAHIYLPSDVIHTAVDYIYQYLSRVHDVPLNDLKLITLGAIWVAAKFEGLQYHNQICAFAECAFAQLKHAELRLLTVIDVNLTKPNAIYFRNRYIIIESSTSTISHLSSFILDMTLHCYTVMILPSSKRAAAALWLARLIEKFDDMRFSDCAGGDNECDIMESVWPDYYHQLSGYHHSDISQLAITMHVIVLAFLCRGQQKNPSVNACYNKYSNETYKNLTASYEKFTSRIVYFGAKLYCRLHSLIMSDWLDKNEYDTLGMRLCEARPLWRRYNSSYHQSHDRKTDHGVNSCPELSCQGMIGVSSRGRSGLSGSRSGLNDMRSGLSGSTSGLSGRKSGLSGRKSGLSGRTSGWCVTSRVSDASSSMSTTSDKGGHIHTLCTEALDIGNPDKLTLLKLDSGYGSNLTVPDHAPGI